MLLEAEAAALHPERYQSLPSNPPLRSMSGAIRGSCHHCRLYQCFLLLSKSLIVNVDDLAFHFVHRPSIRHQGYLKVSRRTSPSTTCSFYLLLQSLAGLWVTMTAKEESQAEGQETLLLTLRPSTVIEEQVKAAGFSSTGAWQVTAEDREEQLSDGHTAQILERSSVKLAGYERAVARSVDRHAFWFGALHRTNVKTLMVEELDKKVRDDWNRRTGTLQDFTPMPWS